MKYMYLTYNDITYFIQSNGIARVIDNPATSFRRTNSGWEDTDGAPVASGLNAQLEAGYGELQ